MKNPYYQAPVVAANDNDPEQVALRAAQKYLASDPNAEDVEDHKIRMVHPALQDSKVWARVKEQLEKGAAIAEKGTGRSSGRSR